MRRLLTLLLGVVMAVSGCTTIPVAGPIEPVPVSAPPRGIELAPEPPQPGILPARVIDGFLQAMADPEADYEVARQYLSSSAEENWDPLAGTQVYDGTVDEDEGRYFLQGVVTGELDQVGRHTPVHRELSYPLPLVQEDGEWRIAMAPTGVLVSRFMFERYYAHATIYFMARSGGYVVPDALHIHEALLTPSRIIEAQIAGPSVGIAPAVRNALPGGAALGPEGASVDSSGTARVSLVGLPDAMEEDRRRDLGAQLVWSLTAVGRVTGLQVLDDGVALSLPGQDTDGVLELASQQGYQVLSRATTPDLFGVRRGVAGRVATTGSFAPMTSGGLVVSEVAVSLDAALVAFIADGRRMVLIGPMGGQLTHAVPDIVEIRGAQFVLGQLWVLGEGLDGTVQLVRIDSQGRSTTIDTSAVPGRIVDFAGSQAGARIAFIVDDGTNQTLGIGALGGGPRVAVVTWSEVLAADDSAVPLTAFADVAWSSEVELAVIARASDGPSVYLISLDGSLVEHLGPVAPGVAQVTALPRMGGDAVAVRTTADEILRYESRTRWSELGLELTEISYPG